MRLIDADAFDDVLIHGELKARKARKYVLESAINTIRGNLAKMPTIEECKTGRWIPCSERLPGENGQYLITVKYVHVDGYDDIYAEHGEWADGKWDMFCFGHCGKVENIIAWMPLPEPYKGEQDGNK